METHGVGFHRCDQESKAEKEMADQVFLVHVK
jgi:hypothetical protein